MLRRRRPVFRSCCMATTAACLSAARYLRQAVWVQSQVPVALLAHFVNTGCTGVSADLHYKMHRHCTGDVARRSACLPHQLRRSTLMRETMPGASCVLGSTACCSGASPSPRATSLHAIRLWAELRSQAFQDSMSTIRQRRGCCYDLPCPKHRTLNNRHAWWLLHVLNPAGPRMRPPTYPPLA